MKVAVPLAILTTIASASAIEGAAQRKIVWMRSRKSRRKNHFIIFE